MKLIIAGGRNITGEKVEELILEYLNEWSTIIEIVHGCCPTGVDAIADYLARVTHRSVHRFPADWATYGRSAGPRRNRDMAKYADRLLLVWDGRSKGSANIKKEMERTGKPVHEIIMEDV